jgi:hypothetical protein
MRVDPTVVVRPPFAPALLLGAAALCGVGSPSDALAQGGRRVCLVASITPQQETPPSPGSSALGAGVFLVDTGANTISYRIVFTGLTSPETGAHIHGFAGPGTPAGVLFPLPAGNVKSGMIAYGEPQEAGILAGNTYVNIHSTNFGAGEIRGQIVTHVAEIDGGQETPAVASPARGWGVFMQDTAANMLRYHIEFGGLLAAESNAHIHGLTEHGTAAGVLHPLPAGSPKTGAWSYPQAIERQICQGLTYVNIHSTMFPAGEIRGQIVSTVVPIDGGQEVPPNASPGAGIGLISLSDATDELGFDIRFAGLTTAENNAHIHGYAPPGAPAGVVFPLGLGARKLGVWNYPAANEAQILGGLSYINIHSVMFGAGEIRGQIQFCNCPCNADWNDDGVVNSQDYFDLLVDFFANDADFNGRDGTNSQDYFDFLAEFFIPCP